MVEWMKKYWICLTVGCAFILTLVSIVSAYKVVDDGLHEEFVEEPQFERTTKSLEKQIVANASNLQQLTKTLEQSTNTQLYIFVNKRIGELHQIKQTRQLTHQEETELVQLEIQLSNLKKQLGIK